MPSIAETPVAPPPPNPPTLEFNDNPLIPEQEVEEMTAPAQPEDETIVITYGLMASDKTCVSIPLSEVLNSEILKTHDCYERTQPTEVSPLRILNRVYVDLDGKLPLDMPENIFNSRVKAITDALLGASDEYSIQQSCKWRCNNGSDYENKISFSLVYPNKCGSKKLIEGFVRRKVFPMLKSALAGAITLALCDAGAKNKKNAENYLGVLLIDTSVYNSGGRKMRMVHTTKPNENRPKTIVRGTLEDSLITYVPQGCEVLENPPTPATPVMSETQSVVTTTTTTPEALLDITLDKEKNLELLRKVIEKLGQHRFDYYPDWIRLGFAMFAEGFTLDDYIAVSKRSCKWVEATSPTWIAEKWSGFVKSRITGAILWRWLSEDDRTAYIELSNSRMDFWLLVANNSHAEASRFFYNLRPDAYTFHSSLGWYVLQTNNTWKLTEDMKTPSELLTDIWTTFKALAKEHLLSLCENGKLKESEDEAEQKLLKAKCKAVCSFIKQCGTAGFAEGMIKYLPSNYYDDDLDKKMDENRNLLAFTDKVLDISTMETRDIEPEDYISLTTGYKYPTERFPQHQEGIMAMLKSIMPTDEMVEALLQALSSSLYGYNRYERFYVLSGKGGNGKGLIADILKRVLGGYFIIVPSSIITKSNDKKDSACPALAKCKGKRFLLVEEPEATDRLQVGLIKDMTGGGTIVARELYKNPIRFVVAGVLYVNTNGIPLANKVDGGYKRRTRVLRFPYNFVAEPTLPHHKKVDYALKDVWAVSDEWRTEFLFILLEAHKRLRAKGSLLEPKQMMEATDEYMDDNNPVKGWLMANFTLGLPEEDRRFWVGSDELRTQYCGDKHTKISAEVFKHSLEQCEMRQEKASHPFNSVRYDRHDKRWNNTECGAGKYWVGLMPITARHPDLPEDRAGPLFLPDTDISGSNILLSTLQHMSS